MSRRALEFLAKAIGCAAIALGATLGTASTPSDMTEIRRLAASGFQAESVARARHVLADAESHAPGSAEEAAALDLNLEVLHNSGLEFSAEARALADRALGLKERLWGRDHPEVARTLVLVARLRITDQPSAARTMIDRARSIQERTLDAADPALRDTDYASFSLERYCGNDGLARELERKTLDVAEATSHADDPRTVLKRLEFALDSDDCEGRLTELRDETLRIFGPRYPLTANAIFDLAMCRWKDHRFDQAREGMEAALAIQRAAFGPAHIQVANTLLTLASLHADCGDRERAERLFRQSIASFTTLDGADSPVMRGPLLQFSWFLGAIGKSDEAFDTATRGMRLGPAELDARCPQDLLRLASYAIGMRDRGDLAGAKTRLEHAAATLDGASSPDSVPYAEVLHYLGETLHDLGDDVRARQLLERSLAMRERVSGEQDISNWVVLNDLSSVLVRFGELDAATAHLQRAIQLLEGGSNIAHGCISTVLRILADVQVRRGDLSGARATLMRALGIAVAAFGDQGGRTELILRDLCTLEGSIGGKDRDPSICARAVKVNERRYGPHHPGMARLMAIEAALSYSAGDSASALRLSIDAEQRSRSHFTRTARTLSEREALSFELARHTGLDVALTVLAAQSPGGPAADAQRVWNEVLRSRSMVLDEVIARRRAFSGGDAEARRLFEQLEAARGQLSQAVRGSVDVTDPGKARGKIADAVARVDAAERTWQARQLKRSGGGRADADLKQVLAALPPGAALVAYVRYRHLDDAQPGMGTPEYGALIAASRNAPIEFIRLGPASDVDRMVADWSSAVSSEPAPGLGRSAESAYRQIAAPLREAIWDPVRARLGSKSLILVVPEGPLHLVALGTLPAADGRYLVETESPIQLLSTERDIVALAVKPTFTGGLLAMGDPAFDAVVDGDSGSAGGGAIRRLADETPEPAPDSMPRGSDRCASFSSLEFQPLPQTLAEVEEVRRAWLAVHDGRQEPESRVLLGADATEQALKRNAASSRVIHLATHGFVLPLQCIQPAGGLATTADEGWLTLAGLALAGANRRNTAASTAADGIVTAEEIASLDLTRTEWVVLSACDSGWGTVLDGEGVFGLRRALQIAGARTTITSLWQIRDEAARDWMGRLYRARMGGDSTVDAVRAATLGALLSRRSRGLDTHPARWGAFSAVGDWR